MAAPKHVADAALKVDEYIHSLPSWSKKICKRLREISLKSDPAMIEDWKWGPNYYCNGMVCGFAAFKTFVNFVFFQGALLKDKKKLLITNPQTLHNRHMRFTDVKEIDEDILLEYLIEAIENNKKERKITETKDKTLVIAKDIAKAFNSVGLLKYFESLAYSHKKEYLLYIEDAKKEETRLRRIEKAISKLASKEMMHDKYQPRRKAVKK